VYGLLVAERRLSTNEALRSLRANIILFEIWLSNEENLKKCLKVKENLSEELGWILCHLILIVENFEKIHRECFCKKNLF